MRRSLLLYRRCLGARLGARRGTGLIAARRAERRNELAALGKPGQLTFRAQNAFSQLVAVDNQGFNPAFTQARYFTYPSGGVASSPDGGRTWKNMGLRASKQIARIVGGASPDQTQFDPDSPYHDPKSTRALPRWLQIDVRFVRKTRLLSLDEMRRAPSLASMRVLQRGNRLSITPVTAAEWSAVLAVLDA